MDIKWFRMLDAVHVVQLWQVSLEVPLRPLLNKAREYFVSSPMKDEAEMEGCSEGCVWMIALCTKIQKTESFPPLGRFTRKNGHNGYKVGPCYVFWFSHMYKSPPPQKKNKKKNKKSNPK